MLIQEYKNLMRRMSAEAAEKEQWHQKHGLIDAAKQRKQDKKKLMDRYSLANRRLERGMGLSAVKPTGLRKLTYKDIKPVLARNYGAIKRTNRQLFYDRLMTIEQQKADAIGTFFRRQNMEYDEQRQDAEMMRFMTNDQKNHYQRMKLLKSEDRSAVGGEAYNDVRELLRENNAFGRYLSAIFPMEHFPSGELNVTLGPNRSVKKFMTKTLMDKLGELSKNGLGADVVSAIKFNLQVAYYKTGLSSRAPTTASLGMDMENVNYAEFVPVPDDGGAAISTPGKPRAGAAAEEPLSDVTPERGHKSNITPSMFGGLSPLAQLTFMAMPWKFKERKELNLKALTQAGYLKGDGPRTYEINWDAFDKAPSGFNYPPYWGSYREMMSPLLQAELDKYMRVQYSAANDDGGEWQTVTPKKKSKKSKKSKKTPKSGEGEAALAATPKSSRKSSSKKKKKRD